MINQNKNFSIKTIEDTKSFFQLREEWTHLLERSITNSFFLSWEWAYSWWQTYSDGKKLKIICVREDGDLIGLAPLFIHETQYYKIPVQEITFIGEKTSDRQDFIIDVKYTVLYDRIIEYIMEENKWDIIRLEQVPHWSQMINKKDYINSDAEETSILPFIKIENNWDDYFKSRSKSLKKDLRNKYNVLNRSGDWRYEFVDDCSIIQKKFDDIVKIELESHKNDKKFAFFSDKNSISLFKNLFRYCQENKYLYLSVIEMNNNPICYLLGYRYNKKYLAYNMAYLPEYYKSSPGKLLFNETIKTCFQRQVKEFDFLRGDTYIKKLWTSENRKNYRVVLFNRKLKSFLLGKLVFSLRPLIKKVFLMTKGVKNCLLIK